MLYQTTATIAALGLAQTSRWSPLQPNRRSATGPQFGRNGRMSAGRRPGRRATKAGLPVAGQLPDSLVHVSKCAVRQTLLPAAQSSMRQTSGGTAP